MPEKVADGASLIRPTTAAPFVAAAMRWTTKEMAPAETGEKTSRGGRMIAILKKMDCFASLAMTGWPGWRDKDSDSDGNVGAGGGFQGF
jgi:hypothetical protein